MELVLFIVLTVLVVVEGGFIAWLVVMHNKIVDRFLDKDYLKQVSETPKDFLDNMKKILAVGDTNKTPEGHYKFNIVDRPERAYPPGVTQPSTKV